MKYVMFEVRYGNKQDPIIKHIPVVFPDDLVHAEVKISMERSIRRHFPDADVKAISAGFISGAFDDIETYGESESTLLKSRREDAKTIATYEYLHGIQT